MSRSGVAACILVAVVVGWSARGGVESVRQDRPVLKAIARLAKMAGWVFLVADDPPGDAENKYNCNLLMGSDGHPFVDHRRAM